MSKNRTKKECQECGGIFDRRSFFFGTSLCGDCYDRQESKEAEAFEGRHDVQALNNCETVEELKEWIKSHLLNR